MTQQLSLFPNSPLDTLNRQQDNKFADLEVALSPVDEVFTASTRLRNSRNFMELLDFIARFPNYSTLLSAHKECHFFRVYFDCEGSIQYSFSSIFNRSNISF